MSGPFEEQFFYDCCVNVEPPRMRPPSIIFFGSELIACIEAMVLVEAPILAAITKMLKSGEIWLSGMNL